MARFETIKAETDLLWTKQDCGHESCNHEHERISAKGGEYNEVRTSFLSDLYNSEVSPGQIQRNLFDYNRKTFNEAIVGGWDFEAGSHKSRLAVLQLQENTTLFSTYRTHLQTLDASNFLFDAQGNKVALSTFIERATPLYDRYNRKWLDVEARYARAASRSAANWDRLTSKPGMLEYRSVRDGKVRDSHAVLDGTILPYADPFWSTWYPPNGWGCRCFIRRVREQEPVPAQGTPTDTPALFKNNVGQSKSIFNENHPFINSVGDEMKLSIELFAKAVTAQNEVSEIRRYNSKEMKGKAFVYQNERFKTTRKSAEHLHSGRNFRQNTDRIEDIEWTLLKNRTLLTPEVFWQNVIEELPSAADTKDNDVVEGYRYFKSFIEGRIFYLEVRMIKNSNDLIWYNINNINKNDRLE